MNNQKIDELFKNKLYDHDVEPSQEAWQKLKGLLPPENKNRNGAYWLFAALLLLATSAALVWNFGSIKNESPEIEAKIVDKNQQIISNKNDNENNEKIINNNQTITDNHQEMINDAKTNKNDSEKAIGNEKFIAKEVPKQEINTNQALTQLDKKTTQEDVIVFKQETDTTANAVSKKEEKTEIKKEQQPEKEEINIIIIRESEAGSKQEETQKQDKKTRLGRLFSQVKDVKMKDQAKKFWQNKRESQ